MLAMPYGYYTGYGILGFTGVDPVNELFLKISPLENYCLYKR